MTLICSIPKWTYGHFKVRREEIWLHYLSGSKLYEVGIGITNEKEKLENRGFLHKNYIPSKERKI